MPIFSSATTKKNIPFKPPRRSSDPFIFDISKKKTDDIVRGANVNELKDHYRYKDGFMIEVEIFRSPVQSGRPLSGITSLYKTNKVGKI